MGEPHADEPLDAGPFDEWLAATAAALRGGRDADVPCAGCTACCESAQFIHVEPDEVDALAHIPRQLLFPAPRRPKGHLLMGYDEHGRCPMLIDRRCSIYAHRPRACRTYDCRVFAATAIVPDDKPAVAVRVRRWRFTEPATQLDAVRRRAATQQDAVAAIIEHLRGIDRPEERLHTQ